MPWLRSIIKTCETFIVSSHQNSILLKVVLKLLWWRTDSFILLKSIEDLRDLIYTLYLSMHNTLEMTSDKILNYFILKWITHKLHNFMKNNNSLQNKNNLVRKNGIVLHCFVKPLLSGLDCWILVSIPTFNVLRYHISHAASRKLHCTLLEKWELTRANNILLFIRKQF